MKNFKADFPIFSQTDAVYLDNAATAQRPQQVLDAAEAFYQRHNANPLRGLYALGMEATEDYEAARARVASFINAPSANNIIFTRNATESINLVAYSYALNNLCADDDILVTIDAHHSNILPWQMVSRQTGAKLVYLEIQPDGSYAPEAVDAAISPRTKLAALTQISNVTGRLHDVAAIARRVHAVGGVVLVDAAQSAPHMPVDVQALDCDFLAFSGHKLLSPMGIGALYGKANLLEAMPPFLTGGEMIDSVSKFDAVYAPVPHKFEAGTVNGGGAVALHAAIDYLEGIDWETITSREDALTEECLAGMKAIPHVHILGAEDAADHHGILSFTIDDVHPHDVASILDADGICVRAGHHCALPLLTSLGIPSTARASLAFYNDEEDITRFLASLKTIRGKMGYGE
ncbi:MAG: SufS family cysteine desulfurase [Peptococcaceae bacterium]|nr:SufS family cysteine desulfurase [Peptococcaceae bacterium]